MVSNLALCSSAMPEENAVIAMVLPLVNAAGYFIDFFLLIFLP
ncbi:hypothetical protein QW180_18070 [Vibrio sinaloensis]|nr:hypothetical protein [Vibrio sinaloensis]